MAMRLALSRLSSCARVMLQPTAQSFTEVELATIATKIVAAAGKLGAYLRG